VYIPPFATIALALGLPDAALEGLPGTLVPVNVQTLRLLLQCVATAADYDEAVYLEENPDIAEAYEAKQITDPHLHFEQAGYFESRCASKSPVDEAWYLKTYPDIADAVAEGAIASGQAHFALRGQAEMRSPNSESESRTRAWAEACALSRQAARKVSRPDARGRSG
jgi:hypothetical protein